MHLMELLKNASDWNDDAGTIYAMLPWACNSQAIIVDTAPNTTEDIEFDGQTYAYFLETFIARDFIEDFKASNGSDNFSEVHGCERLIQYAINDA